jgi:hypothetical protein
VGAVTNREGAAVSAVVNSGVAVGAVTNREGAALQADGPVQFINILCTLDTNQRELILHRVTKKVSNDTFRITLSGYVVPGKTASVRLVRDRLSQPVRRKSKRDFGWSDRGDPGSGDIGCRARQAREPLRGDGTHSHRC